jgi:hypothetical protein
MNDILVRLIRLEKGPPDFLGGQPNMPAASHSPRSSSLFSWGLALAATSLLTIGSGSLIWSQRETEPEASAEIGAIQPGPLEVRFAFLPEVAQEKIGPSIHTVAYGVENGTAVVRIRVVPNGDELIVDAATGRLLETRPNRPTAPPPMGKFAAPFTPVM